MTQDMGMRVVASYEIIGERHASRALDSVCNDYYERPVTYSLLGDVKNQRVLDAGCGSGSYAVWLGCQQCASFGFDIRRAQYQTPLR